MVAPRGASRRTSLGFSCSDDDGLDVLKRVESADDAGVNWARSY
jgi:hypothetical protein